MSAKNRPSLKRIAIVAAVIVCLFAIDIYYTGFMKFGYIYLKCGGAPIVVHPSALGIGQSKYLLPGKYFPVGT